MHPPATLARSDCGLGSIAGGLDRESIPMRFAIGTVFAGMTEWEDVFSRFL